MINMNCGRNNTQARCTTWSELKSLTLLHDCWFIYVHSEDKQELNYCLSYIYESSLSISFSVTVQNNSLLNSDECNHSSSILQTNKWQTAHLLSKIKWFLFWNNNNTVLYVLDYRWTWLHQIKADCITQAREDRVNPNEPFLGRCTSKFIFSN